MNRVTIDGYWIDTPVPLCMRDLETRELGCTIAFPNSDGDTWLLGTESVYVRLRAHKMGYSWFTSATSDGAFAFYGIQYLPAGDSDGVYRDLVHPAILELIDRGEYPDFIENMWKPKGA